MAKKETKIGVEFSGTYISFPTVAEKNEGKIKVTLTRDQAKDLLEELTKKIKKPMRTALEERKFNGLCKKLTNFCLPSVKRKISVVSSFDTPRKKLRYIFTNRMKYKDNLLFVTPHKVEAAWYKTAITLCSWYFRVNGEEICVFYFGKEGEQFAEWFKNYGNIFTEPASY